ncbi:coilin [Periophthalmus magnuspinnatus]|uniref:coilin n=1 Tax=Periophthalmus magnuspinnatus TaxID=409849 RepID=UPI00145BAE3C|nr:coilin [Periophthalmus magnuspinnatus]
MTANFIRVRLHFDYAPPAVAGCRMCWLLVDLRSCRVVADLEGIIRDKFELSRGSILSLFIEDCYLPHTESILVVRDNDCVRVKVDSVSTTKTIPETTSDNKRKRHRPTEDEGLVENSSTLEFKKKKRKKSVLESPAVNCLQTETEQLHTISNKDKKKQKDEKRKSASAPILKKSEKSIPKIVTTTSNTTKKPQSSSSSSTSSSEDEGPVTKIPTPKPISKPALKSNLTSPKIIQNGRSPSKKLPPPTSSSSDTDSSSEEEDKTAKAKSTNDKSKSGEVSQQSANSVIQNGGNDSDEEIQLVIKKPVQHPHGRIMVGHRWQQPGGEAGRGRGRGKPEPKELWGKGKGNCIQYNYQEKERGKKEASYSTDSLTNVSVILQNGTGLPKPDYSSMPLLAAPPQVGQKIAFKLLELTENYTPEVSDYKEAKILSFDPNTKQIELELLTSFQAPVEPGKFDLVYQNPDGSERVEYAVDRGSLVTERWDSLLEPRLFI